MTRGEGRARSRKTIGARIAIAAILVLAVAGVAPAQQAVVDHIVRNEHARDIQNRLATVEQVRQMLQSNPNAAGDYRARGALASVMDTVEALTSQLAQVAATSDASALERGHEAWQAVGQLRLLDSIIELGRLLSEQRIVLDQRYARQWSQLGHGVVGIVQANGNGPFDRVDDLPRLKVELWRLKFVRSARGAGERIERTHVAVQALEARLAQRLEAEQIAAQGLAQAREEQARQEAALTREPETRDSEQRPAPPAAPSDSTLARPAAPVATPVPVSPADAIAPAPRGAPARSTPETSSDWWLGFKIIGPIVIAWTLAQSWWKRRKRTGAPLEAEPPRPAAGATPSEVIPPGAVPVSATPNNVWPDPAPPRAQPMPDEFTALEATPYRNAADTVVAMAFPVAQPMITAGSEILTGLGGLTSAAADDVALTYDLEGFLRSFHSAGRRYLEDASSRLAEEIRRQSRRSDIRAQTTEALAAGIRREGFRRIDAALERYATVMTALGTTIDGISTAGAAVEGAIAGGAVQALATGHRARVGLAAGAVVGAVIAEARKDALKKQQLETAFEAAGEVIEAVEPTSIALIDQYVTYVVGSDIDFASRDAEVARVRTILRQVSRQANVVLTECRRINGHLIGLPTPTGAGCFTAMGIAMVFLGLIVVHYTFPPFGGWLDKESGFISTVAILALGWGVGRYMHRSIYLPNERQKRRDRLVQWIGGAEGVGGLRAAVEGLEAIRRSVKA